MKPSLQIYLFLFVSIFLCIDPKCTLAQQMEGSIASMANNEFAQNVEERERPAIGMIGGSQGMPQVRQAAPEGMAAAAAVPAAAPIMQINRIDSEKELYSFELRDAELKDLFRLLAHDYKLNLIVDKDVKGKVTASLSSISLEEALDTIAESENLMLEKKGNIIRVTSNLMAKTFILKFIEAKGLLEAQSTSSGPATQGVPTTQGGGVPVQSAVAAQGASPQGPSAIGAAQGPSGQQSSSGAGGTGQTSARKANTIYDLLSDKGIILLGRQPNSLTVIDYPSNIKKVEDYLMAIDQKMSSHVFRLKYLKAADIVGAVSSSGTASGTGSGYGASGTGSGSSSGSSSGSISSGSGGSSGS